MLSNPGFLWVKSQGQATSKLYLDTANSWIGRMIDSAKGVVLKYTATEDEGELLIEINRLGLL